MLTFTPDESRVLGVLIEKATTTPDQYPLSLNAITNGSNQKNNRDPVMALTEDQAFEAVEGLRGKGLVVRVDQAGSRVTKFRHQATEVLHLRIGELAILAELLMRGTQTLGELRGRASRMSPMDSLEVARDLLRALMERPEPYVKVIAASPGSRAERYLQLFCEGLHAVEDEGDHVSDHADARDLPVENPVGASTSSATPTIVALAAKVEQLSNEVAQLRAKVEQLTQSLGG